MNSFLETFIKESNLDNLYFCKYKFTIQFHNKVVLPEYHGSMIRGTFGDALKEIVCIKDDGNCNSCKYLEGCAFPYIFDKNTISKKRKVPHPYIIEPERFDGNKLTFNIILIGKAIKYTEQIFYTVRRMGSLGFGVNREKFKLIKVENLIENNKYETIYNGIGNYLEKYSAIYIKNLDFNFSNTVSLNILTQMKIEDNGKIVKDLSFNILLRSLYRRISNMLYIYCDSKLNIDYMDLFERSKSVITTNQDLYLKTVDRFSSTQNKKTELIGIKGNIEFSGLTEDFYILVFLGQYLHVGKGISFGMGRYIINQIF